MVMSLHDKNLILTVISLCDKLKNLIKLAHSTRGFCLPPLKKTFNPTCSALQCAVATAA